MGRTQTRLLLLLLSFPVRELNAGDSDKERVEQVVRLHQATREQILTLHCQAERRRTVKVSSSPEEQFTEFEYWYSHQKARFKYRRSKQDNFVEVAIVNNRAQSLGYRPNDPVAKYKSSINQLESPHTIEGDGFWESKLILNLPGDLIPLTVEQLVARSEKTVSFEEFQEDGDTLYRFVLRFPFSKENKVYFDAEVTLSKRANYSVKSYRIFSGSKPGARTNVCEEVVLSYQEFPGGIFVGNAISHQFIVDGKIQSKGLSRITNIQVNQPIPDSFFVLKIPRGTLVGDNIKGVSYRVDETGEKITKEFPLVASIGDLPESSTRDPILGPIEETFEEPSSTWPKILLWSFVALLIGAIAYRVYAMRRSSETNT